MVFSSPIFLFYFLPLVLLCYFLFSKSISLQNALLFFSSLLFYFWGEKSYTVLVLLSILINYVVAYGMDHYANYRKLLLYSGVALNLGLLIYFKYVNFVLAEVLPLIGIHVTQKETIHLPLGISFYTFHGITYIVDVYRKEASRCKSLLHTGLYILFFPQLIAGPIVKFMDIEKQLYNRIIQNEKLYSGIQRFIIGFAKKVILANALGLLSDTILQLTVPDLSTPVIWLGAISYALQIYYDFSGYSDMAIGLARIMGFDFKENFNFPFAATSFSELWQRWHMSLTGFFKNYVYIPLGGNRKGLARTYLHILFVFTLIGLWHGASWNCILWGVFIGLFIGLEKWFLGNILRKLPRLIGNIYTLLLFCTAIIIFRYEDISTLSAVLTKAFTFESQHSGLYPISYFLTREYIFFLFVGGLLSYPIHQFKLVQTLVLPLQRYRWIKDVVYLVLFVVSVSIMAASTYNPFIYFKF